jgi:hypothetical protein
MALSDRLVAQRVLQLHREGNTWDQHDENAIWHKLFVNNIFKLSSMATHIWVIDGLDECLRLSYWFKLVPQLPLGLRVFLTSRSTDEIERGIASLGTRVCVQPLANTDTGKGATSIS